MLRTNGGLIGVRRTPTIVAASGVWSLVEQPLYQRLQQWPSNNPIFALSPVLWYDFSDDSTVTLSGSTITSISDKGSRGWTLTSSATGPTYSSTAGGINNLRCCDWGNPGHSNYMRNTSATATDIAEIYVVLDANFGSTFPTYNGLLTEAVSNPGWYATGNSGTSGFDNVNGSPLLDQVYVNNSGTAVYASGILPTINSPSLLRLKKSTSAAYSSTKGFQIGADRYLTARGWGGLIGEIVAFSTVLSTQNRTTVQNFLANKWGLTLA